MLRVLMFLFSLSLPWALFSGGARESDGDLPGRSAPEAAVTGEYPRTITDGAGKTVTLEAPARRIVSLGPNITETVFALGRGELLAGRTDWCDYPPEAAALPSVGTLQDPSIETILAREPDLVIGSTHAPMEVMARLDQAGIPTAALFGEESFQGVFQVISWVAELTDAREEGRSLSADIRSRLDAVEARVASLDSRPRVYFVVGFGEGGDWTAGGDTFIHSMITLAGGENIAASLSGWSYSLEKLVEEDPDMILLNRGLKAPFCAAPVYSELRAVREGRVYEVDENLIVRQGPRLIQGVELMNRLFSGGGESLP